MKDYSAMSDFEVNKQVAHYFYGEFETAEGCVFVDAKGDGANVILISGVYDPCNNPADAWPIIAENKINIDHRESIKAGVMATKSGNKEIYAVDSNPLRAAMIVYLQMMEQKS